MQTANRPEYVQYKVSEHNDDGSRPGNDFGRIFPKKVRSEYIAHSNAQCQYSADKEQSHHVRDVTNPSQPALAVTILVSVLATGAASFLASSAASTFS